MKVYLIGKTAPQLFQQKSNPPRYEFPGKAGGSKFEERFKDDKQWGLTYWNQVILEFAGRLCYESWDLPNEPTSTMPGYLKNILSQGHESVLEHVSVTFYVEEVSRNLSHELIRHRHLSFSELSQRFVDMKESNFVNPPALRTDKTPTTWSMAESVEVEDYEETVDFLRERGKTRKQAREAARYFLPSGLETKFVVTGNLRSWRDVLKKRDSEHADAEMQEFAKEIKRILKKEYPDVFSDLEE